MPADLPPPSVLEAAPDVLARLDPDEQALISIQGISRGNDQVNVVNEPGLYSLVLGSRKPEAKRFKRWVTHEVLPAIRKTGRYEAARRLEALRLGDPRMAAKLAAQSRVTC